MSITSVTQFKQLEHCKMIDGSLEFFSFTYNKVRFPNLLYINDLLRFYNISNLTSVRQLLPNLIHILGSDEALSISKNKDLEKLDFKKLMKIDHGSVSITDNPRLCLNDIISWSDIQDKISKVDKHIQV